MRIIDADKLIETIPTVMDMQDAYLPIHFKEWLIDSAPTIDAVEVVRCKECKNSIASVDNSLCCRCWYDSLGFWEEVKADDFCSYGERKGE